MPYNPKPPPITTKKRKKLSVLDKYQIIQNLESGISNSKACEMYSLSTSTISTIWKNRDIIFKEYENNNLHLKKVRNYKNMDVDEALYKWFKTNRQDEKCRVNGSVLQTQAERIGRQFGLTNFTCSRGWIDRFKKRHNLSFGKDSEEDRSSANEREIESWLMTTWNAEKIGYSDDDIFNLDETGLFYNLTPDNKTRRTSGDESSDGRSSKDRVSVLVGANLSGTEKNKLLIIGSEKKRSCFQNVKTLPVEYKSNDKPWMTRDIWEGYLTEWDKRLKKAKRKILVLIGDRAAYSTISGLENIKLVTSPFNLTSVLQQTDHSIVTVLKYQYREKLILKYLASGAMEKLDVLEAFRLLAESWQLVTPEIIKNSFRKAGIVAGEKVSKKSASSQESLVTWKNDIDVPIAISIVDYIETDSGLVVTEMQTGSINDGNDGSDEESSDEKELEPSREKNNILPVCASEALDALNKICQFCETNAVEGNYFEPYCKLKKIVEDVLFRKKD